MFLSHVIRDSVFRVHAKDYIMLFLNMLFRAFGCHDFSLGKMLNELASILLTDWIAMEHVPVA